MQALTQIGKRWRSFSLVLRRLAIVLWVAGIALLALGVLGDRLSWWSDRPFLANLVSSMVGACFGIPVAVLILQRLAAAQADALEMRNAARLTIGTIEEMRWAADRLVFKAAKTDTHSLLTGLSALVDSADLDAERVRHVRVADVKALEEKMHSLRALLPEKRQLETAAFAFESAWSFLKVSVRARLAELGMHWLSTSTAYHIQANVDSVFRHSFDWLVEIRGEGRISEVLLGAERYAAEHPHTALDPYLFESFFLKVQADCQLAEEHLRASILLLQMCFHADDAIKEAFAGHLSPPR